MTTSWILMHGRDHRMVLAGDDGAYATAIRLRAVDFASYTTLLTNGQVAAMVQDHRGARVWKWMDGRWTSSYEVLLLDATDQYASHHLDAGDVLTLRGRGGHIVDFPALVGHALDHLLDDDDGADDDNDCDDDDNDCDDDGDDCDDDNDCDDDDGAHGDSCTATATGTATPATATTGPQLTLFGGGRR